MQQNLTPRYLIIGVILAWGIYTLWPSWQYQNMSDEKKEELRESGDLKTIESKIYNKNKSRKVIRRLLKVDALMQKQYLLHLIK